MNKLLTLVAAVLLSLGARAQATQKMSYQAVVRNAANSLVTNTAVGMRRAGPTHRMPTPGDVAKAHEP